MDMNVRATFFITEEKADRAQRPVDWRMGKAWPRRTMEYYTARKRGEGLVQSAAWMKMLGEGSHEMPRIGKSIDRHSTIAVSRGWEAREGRREGGVTGHES